MAAHAIGAFLDPFFEGRNMQHRDAMLDGFQRAWGADWSLPETRRIEMYTRKKKRDHPLDTSEAPRCAEIAGARHAFALLEAACAGTLKLYADEMRSWELYQVLPRASLSDRIVAEAFRLLRIVRIGLEHPAGEIRLGDDLVKFECLDKNYPVMLGITPAGLRLLQSLVFYYLDAPNHEYGEAYTESILSAYYTDIVTELRGFEDEDHALYQFRRPIYVNRHFRLDCLNPRTWVEDGRCHVELGPVHNDQHRFPLDFHILVQDQDYIVPVEALTDNSIELFALERWKVRTRQETAPHTPNLASTVS